MVVKKHNLPGFTLIEMLIVVLIIGILASIMILNLREQQVRSRDAKRMADLRSMTKAIESYFINNNKYPAKPAGCTGTGGTTFSSNTPNFWSTGTCDSSANPDNFIVGLVPSYMTQLPSDPGPIQLQTYSGVTGNVRAYLYQHGVDGEYKIMTHRPEKCEDGSRSIWDPQRSNTDVTCHSWASFSAGGVAY